MKAAALILLSLGLAGIVAAQPAQSTTESNGPMPSSVVRGQIMELLKQDVRKIPLQPNEDRAPFLNPDSAPNDQPVAEGVLELDPIAVTQKRATTIPPRVDRITLDNFFYGDGTIAESASRRVSLAAGPYGSKGLAALKLNFKF